VYQWRKCFKKGLGVKTGNWRRWRTPSLFSLKKNIFKSAPSHISQMSVKYEAITL
jgi:hypothetical protein